MALSSANMAAHDTGQPTLDVDEDLGLRVMFEGFTDDEASDSSSDDSVYISPIYGNPSSYTLHTILEESCEESEKSSRSATPVAKQPSSELEKYFSFAIGNIALEELSKRWSLAASEDLSDSISETSNADDGDVLDDDPAVLASSRLEKYFTSGLLGTGSFNYPDDAEFSDESSNVSSDEERTHKPQGVLAFEEDSIYNTVKRKKKTTETEESVLEKEDDCVVLPSVHSEKTLDITCNQVATTLMSENLAPADFVGLGSEVISNVDSTSGIESMCDSSVNDATVQDTSTKEDTCNSSSKIVHSRSSSTDGYSDEEAAYIVNRVIAHISGMKPECETKHVFPPWKALLESQITRLMQSVSPAALSTESSCSSTIGSNNSDYGSDTLESEYTSTDDESSPKVNKDLPSPVEDSKQTFNQNCDNVSGHSSDSTISEETLFICKQLMVSLKRLSEDHVSEPMTFSVISDHNHNDYLKAQEYIQDQIVALMHTVSGSRNGSPLRERKHRQLINVHDGSDNDSANLAEEKTKGSKSKTPSESGSETISTSISIPSYDSDHTPTESEISHEMDELFNLLENSSGVLSDNVSLSKLSCCDGEESSDHLMFAHFVKSDVEGSTRLDDPLSCIRDTQTYEFSEQDCDKELAGMFSGSKCDSSSTLTAGSDLDFCGSVETVLEVNPKASPEPSISPLDQLTETSDKSRSESSLYIKARKGPGQRKLVFTRSSDSLSPSKKGEHRTAFQLFRPKASSKSDYSIPDSTISDDKDDGSEADTESSVDGSLSKSINSKEKSSSENNLLVAKFSKVSKSQLVSGTKSVGNISELENSPNKSVFRDTGYYSFKSSEESILSFDESPNMSSSASLTLQKSLPSSETIPEVEEEPVRPSRSGGSKSSSLSSSSIPESVFKATNCKSSTLPPSLRSKITRPSAHSSSMVLRQRHFSSTFFSTSGVLRKLTALKADDSSGSHRSSPRGRLRSRVRHPSGGSDDARPSSIPAINISTGENSSVRSSLTSTDKDSLLQEEDVEHIYTAYSRSQTSLSSIGQARSESMTSVYSAAGGGRYGTVTVTGEVFFGLVYNYKCGTMEVHVKECRNLAPVDTKRNRSDPYVKVYLLPDKTKSGKRKTKVKKHTLSPVFDEVLKFKVTISELETRTLWLSVWHSDMFGRNDFLGEVMLTLGYEAFENSGIRWYPLQERLESPETPLTYKGDLILSLKYMPPDVTRKVQQAGTPKKGSLHILVKEARNLMATRSNGTSDPFCKSYLLPDKTKGSKQKTPVMKKTCSPKWNHTFVYPDISLEELKERCLELTVWDYDKITSNDFLGGVRLGLGTGKYQGKDVDWMDSQGEEVTLWRAMVERPNLWIDGSLLLRPTLQSRR